MKREDFVFAIGFDGNKVIVDKRSRGRYSKMDTRSLADNGLFRVAYRSAVYESDKSAAEYVLEKFNAVSSIQYDKISDLDKVFGVQHPSDGIIGIRAIQI